MEKEPKVETVKLTTKTALWVSAFLAISLFNIGCTSGNQKLSSEDSAMFVKKYVDARLKVNTFKFRPPSEPITQAEAKKMIANYLNSSIYSDKLLTAQGKAVQAFEFDQKLIDQVVANPKRIKGYRIYLARHDDSDYALVAVPMGTNGRYDAVNLVDLDPIEWHSPCPPCIVFYDGKHTQITSLGDQTKNPLNYSTAP